MRFSLKNKKLLARFKRRHYYPRVAKQLIWGNSGLKLLSRAILPRRRLRWIKIWMKWHYKLSFLKFKKKKRGRYYWFKLKNCMPCTKKSDKSRMGKGKGKLVGWYCNLLAGNIILELRITKFKTVRPLFKYFSKKFTANICGIIQYNYRSLQAFSGTLGDAQYFQQDRLLSYRRQFYKQRKISTIRLKIDL